MPLTAAHVQKALSAVGASGRQMKATADLASGANTALAQAPSGLTKEGAAAFLATMAQESDYFRTTTEYGSARKRYDPYRGRTFEQVTWRENYAAFGKWCKAKGLISDADYFVDNPARLSDYQWAWLGGVWYFQHAGLWKYANRGDFKAVSQGVNGGTGRIGTSFTPNGWVHRLAMYEAYLLAGSALLPDGKATPAKPKATPKPAPKKATPRVLRTGSKGDDVKALQRGLNRVFPAYSKLRVDGSYGAATAKVVREFQSRSRLKTDGVTGPATRAALARSSITF